MVSITQTKNKIDKRFACCIHKFLGFTQAFIARNPAANLPMTPTPRVTSLASFLLHEGVFHEAQFCRG